jgi:malate/lactate dehydrogenase
VKLRKMTSVASAGNAAMDHMRDWVMGSDEWQSISCHSEGNPYGVPPGLIFSFPCTTANGKYTIVPGISFDDEESQARIDKTVDELIGERRTIEHLLK